jgi:hypothetical protein
MTWIFVMGAIALSFIGGFLLGAWVRQEDINGLRNDLLLAQDRETRLTDQCRELRSAQWR